MAKYTGANRTKLGLKGRLLQLRRADPRRRQSNQAGIESRPDAEANGQTPVAPIEPSWD
mgnify:CR=1 FL=1